VIYADADGATPFSEIERLITAIKEGADIAIGSRALKTKDTSINTVWYRKVMGRVFNGIVNLVVLPGVSDTQCGFKLFTREAAFKVVNLQKEERFSFDVELLYLARKFGYQIKEVAVNWHNVPGSKVRLVNDSAKMFVDIFRIKCRSALGSYPVP
jgi:dolichyl-phosphate beta-glucosyltransferase